ncbi:MAG: hypothetical protein ABN485_09110, partial [Pantoea agglomerans]
MTSFPLMSFGQNERKARLNRRSGCDSYLTIVKKGFIKPQIGSNGKMMRGSGEALSRRTKAGVRQPGSRGSGFTGFCWSPAPLNADKKQKTALPADH